MPMVQAPHAPLTQAHNRLWLPRLALSGCVRAVMLRSTVGQTLNAAQRYNHFPATPLVSMSWWFSGRSDMLVAGAVQSEHPPPDRWLAPTPGLCALGGPFTRPSISFNRGPVHGLMLLLQPDALQRLTGVDPQALVNRLCDAQQALPAPWADWCGRVQAAPDDDARLRCIEDFLLPQWQAAGGAATDGSYAAWMQGLALRAATSPAGRSLRQVERRIKQWAGLPLRELRGLSRAERAFFHAMAVAEQGAVSWAEVAGEGGYADQSHLCRETRRLSGFSPAELRRRIESDESFWPYRIWE